MFRDSSFRRALDECLARIGQGDSIEACLAAHPGQAEKLGSFLRAASIMWKIEPPQPTSQAMARARNKLLQEVEGGSGKEAVFMGMFKFAHVAVMAVATFFAASIGLVAAAGGTDFITAPFGGHDGETFEARVVSSSETLMFIERDDGFAYLWLNSDTRFQDAEGHDIDRTDIRRNDRVRVRATHDYFRYFTAHLIRLVGGDPGPEPTVKPDRTHEPEPTKVADPTPVETPKPMHEPTPKATPKETAKATPKETAKATPKATEKPVTACEFYGGVTAIAETHLTVQTDLGAKTVWTSATTQFPEGYPFVGVMVGVFGTKNDDGSCNASKVKVKTNYFSGVIHPVDGDTYKVIVDTHEKFVNVNGQTTFPTGMPEDGDPVDVKVYIMADWSYLAIAIKVKAPVATTFEGTVIGNQPDVWTLLLNVGGTEKSICYEFASNAGDIKAVGASIEGKTVRIHTHPEKGAGYAALVEVLN